MHLLCRSELIVVDLVLILLLEHGDATIAVLPKDFESQIGTSAFFNCSPSVQGADVQWNHYPISKNQQVVYAFGKINLIYADRFSLQDGHNLVISSVKVDDAGTYECLDDYGQGAGHSAELVVLQGDPICQSNTNLNKVVGKNTCGIEPTQVTLSCVIQFQGNKAPKLEWRKNGEDKQITSGISSETRGNRFLYNLTLNGHSIANGSSYNCRPAKATSTSATCNSGVITTVAKSDVDSGYECQFYNGLLAIIFTGVAVISIGVTTFFLWKFRRENGTLMEANSKLKEEFESHLYNQEYSDYAENPSHVTDIKTDAAEKENIYVYGMAVLENKLFVIHENYAKIEVYDLEDTYKEIDKLEIPEIAEPFDLTCGKTDNCLFINGASKNAENSMKDPLLSKIGSKYVIVRLDVNGKLLQPWPVPADEIQGRLSAYKSNLVVCFTDKKVIKEFSRDGDVLHTVPVLGVGLPSHAIKVSSMHFAVSYNNSFVDESGICVIDLGGKIIKSYTSKYFKMPQYLMHDRERSFLVAERQNRHVSLLNSALKYQRKLIEYQDRQHPIRICFNETQDLLFVANREEEKVEDNHKVTESYKPCPIQVFNVRPSNGQQNAIKPVADTEITD